MVRGMNLFDCSYNLLMHNLCEADLIKNELTEKYSILTIHGTSEAYIENFMSIIELSDAAVKIKAQREIVVIEGSKLLVEYMNSDDIKICGTIEHIRIVEVQH